MSVSDQAAAVGEKNEDLLARKFDKLYQTSSLQLESADNLEIRKKSLSADFKMKGERNEVWE